MKMPWPNSRLFFFPKCCVYFVVVFSVERLNEKIPASKECYAPHAMYQPLLPDLEPKTLPSAPCFFLLAEFLKINSGPKGWDFKGFEGYTELLLLQVQFDMFTFVFGVNCRYPYNHFHFQNPFLPGFFFRSFVY